MTSRRSLLIAAGAALVAGPALAQGSRLGTVLSAEDRALVDRAVAYLQGLTTARGRFIQTDARGQVTQGQVYIQRPGKARFAYDPPSGLLVVANGSTVSVWDSRLRSFQSYPLRATALNLFLGRNINLSSGVIVDQVVRHDDGGFEIVARDARRQAEGRIRLTFSAATALTGWALTDAQGQTTRVQLIGFAPSGALDQNLFVLRDPRPRPGMGGRP
jgi:outer membrane lipoprotein-sorting protein